MNRKSIIAFLMVLLMILCACSSQRKANGWYPLADYPENTIVGKPLVTVKDFETVEIIRDTFIINSDTVSRLLIQGRVKPEKRGQWADGTERLIGKRLGFVFNDSVITPTQINARIESAAFK